jgi:RNA polymerase-binding transcription factor DksA
MTHDDAIALLEADLKAAQEELVELSAEATSPPEAELGEGPEGYSTWQSAIVLKQHVENQIAELEAALAHARKGLYGKCEVCGRPIPKERLEVLPYTTLCVEHAAAKKPSLE